AVPIHAPADRARLRVPCTTTALQDQMAEGRRGVRLFGPRTRRAAGSRAECWTQATEGRCDPTLQGPRRDERPGTLGHHDEPGTTCAAAGHPRRRCYGGRVVLGADG